MKVLRWVCHCEKHKGSGIHYHCGFKLREMRKWISVKERTQKSIIFHLNLLILNLSDYRYACNEITDVAHSKNYPNLQEAKSQAILRSIAATAKSTTNKATKSSWLLSLKCHLFHKRAQNPVIYKFASSCWSKAKGKQENMAQFLFSRTKRIH